MQRKIAFHLFSTILAMGVVHLGFGAGTPEDSGLGVHVNDDGVAAQGADVVAYFSLAPGASAALGNERYAFVWQGATWLFSSTDNLDAFAVNPDRYAPRYGGYCAWAMARNKLATIDPDRWDIADDRLYLNYNATTQKSWLDNQASDIDRADENWPAWIRQLENGE